MHRLLSLAHAPEDWLEEKDAQDDEHNEELHAHYDN